MSGYVPSVFCDSLHFFVGTPATGRARAGNTTLDTVVFTQYPGQPVATTFTPEDVGCPIAIIGGGPVNPLMPAPYFVQGSLFHTTIAAYVSPSEVVLADAPDTSIFNTGFVTVICYRRCLMQLDKFDLTKSIAPGTRDTLDVAVLAVNNPYIDRFSTIANGQPVYLKSTDPLVGEMFGGFIDTLAVANMVGTTGTFSWSCHCAAWNALAGRRVVPPGIPRVFSGPGEDVFAKIVLYYLSDEGVSVDADPADEITVGCPVGAHVDKLLDDCVQALSAPGQEWYWTTDPWRKFILRPRAAVAAPWDIDDGEDLLAGQNPIQLELITTHDKLATLVYSLGSQVLINALNATLRGTAAGDTTFNLPLPIATVPTITLNGTPQTVGILGIDTGKDWYWNQGSTTLTQDDGGAPLTPADALLVAYQTAVAAVAQSPNSASLAERSAQEGTSGIFNYVIQVSQPLTPAQLLLLASTYSSQYGIPARTVKISTLRPGIDPGQEQNIILPDIGVSSIFLVATTRITVKDRVIQWDYSAFSGANVGTGITGLVQFINRGEGTLTLLTEATPISGEEPAEPATGQNAIHAGLGASVSFPNPVTQGSLLVLVVNRNTVLGNPPAVSDTQGNTWTQAQFGQTGGGFPNQISILYAFASASGACAVTCLTAEWQAVMEFTGIETSGPVDVAGVAVGVTPPTLTVVDGDVVVTGLCSVGAVPTVIGPEVLLGYQLNTAQPGVAFSYDKPAAGPFTSSLADASGGATSVFVSVAFKHRAASGPPPQIIDVAANANVTVTTKGDIQGFSTAPARVPVGTDGFVLTADSGAALGVSWQPAGAGSDSIIGTAKFDVVAGVIANARYTGQVSGASRTTGGIFAVALTGAPVDYVVNVSVRNQTNANFVILQNVIATGFDVIVLNGAQALNDPDSVYVTVVLQP